MAVTACGPQRPALTLGDYVVTEAGFGADLGAEKFIDIKCRSAGLEPDAVVIVATVKALKYHGGANASQLSRPDAGALERGLCNLQKHIENITGVFGLPAVVAVNRFNTDTDEELEIIKRGCRACGHSGHRMPRLGKRGRGRRRIGRSGRGFVQPKESL